MTNADQGAGQPDRPGLLDPEGGLSAGGGRAALPARPPSSLWRLKRSIEVFPASDGALYLLRSGASAEFVVEQAGAGERAVINALASGFVTESDLDAVFDAAGDEVSIAEALARLNECDLLERREKPLLSQSDRERYDRQLIYFGDLARPGETAETFQRRLGDAKVVLLGCGGLGSWTTCGLACAGIGGLVLVDDDRVELSNLNRQLLFGEDDLGRAKVDAARSALARHRGDLTIETHERRVTCTDDIAQLLPGADLLIATADHPPHLLPRWVNEACLAAGVAYITAGQFLPQVRVGPMVVPGRSACHECLENQIRDEYPLYDELVQHRIANPTTAATIGAASGLVGSMLAMEAIHFLSGAIEPASLDAALIIDLRTMEISREGVGRDRDCPQCRPSSLAREPTAQPGLQSAAPPAVFNKAESWPGRRPGATGYPHATL